MCPRRLLGAARFVCAGGRGRGLWGMWVGGVCSCPAIGTYGAALFRSAVNLFFLRRRDRIWGNIGGLSVPPSLVRERPQRHTFLYFPLTKQQAQVRTHVPLEPAFLAAAQPAGEGGVSRPRLPLTFSGIPGNRHGSGLCPSVDSRYVLHALKVSTLIPERLRTASAASPCTPPCARCSSAS